MNGRLYDPELGRMLSPDNVVQDGGYSQNYNRYSYAYNNPLRYTDPDGNEIVIFIIIGAVTETLMSIRNLAISTMTLTQKHHRNPHELIEKTGKIYESFQTQ